MTQKKAFFLSFFIHLLCIAIAIGLAKLAKKLSPEYVEVELSLESLISGGGNKHTGFRNTKQFKISNNRNFSKARSQLKKSFKREIFKIKKKKVEKKVKKTISKQKTEIKENKLKETVKKNTNKNISEKNLSEKEFYNTEKKEVSTSENSKKTSILQSGEEKNNSGVSKTKGKEKQDVSGNTGRAGSGNIDINSIKQTFLRKKLILIYRIIESNIEYPYIARKLGWEGKVVVSFILTNKGEIKNIHIEKSSGYKILDKNVIKCIKKCAKLFPVPPITLKIKLPIVYKLTY